MFNLGTLFSICSGILIGLKIYYRYLEKAEKRTETQREYESFKDMNKRINERKRMQDIINQEKYGVVYLNKDERIVPLKDGKYLLIKDSSSKTSFWKKLWYGTGEQ